MRYPVITVIWGLAGYLLFLVLFAAFDDSRYWQLSLSRTQAVERGRAVASELGVDASDWSWAAGAQSQDRAGDFLRFHPDDPAAPYLDPVRIGVRLSSADGSQGLQLELSPGGDLRRFVWRDRERGGSQEPESALGLAEETLARLVPDPGRFTLLPDQPTQDDDRLRYVWEFEGGGEAVPRVEVELGGSSVLEAGLGVRFSEEFIETVRNSRSGGGALKVLLVCLIFGAVIAGLGFYVSGSFRRLVDQRSVVLLIIVAVLLHLVALVGGGGWDAENLEGDTLLELLLVGVLFAVGVIAPCVAGLWGGTFALASSALAEKNVTAELLAQRGPQIRQVSHSLLSGWAAGGYLAAAPYFLASAWQSPELVVPAVEPNNLLAPLPILPPLDWFSDFRLLALAASFAFFYPFVARYLKPGYRQRAVQTALATLTLSTAFVEAPVAAALLVGLAAAVLGDWVFRRRDLLAVLALAPSLALAKQGATHLLQPAPGIQVWGLVIFGLCLALLPILAAVSVLGAPIDLEREIQKRRLQALRLENLRKAERDRLLAEFSVAQRAQRQMLPEVPPRVDGFQLAAVCHPAREVGGDLYDFVPLGPRLWGAVVADVSGKGVPAALYMTLTKGLLQSLGNHSERPAALVCEINRHLHAVARRSVFVTMVLGVIDLESGAVSCFRAGHNPLIWRRATHQESRIVMPSGLGLGLTSRGLFERSLTEEQIRMEPGDALFLYSDGIPEAMNREGAEYGEERLLRAVGRTDGLTAQEACEVLLSDVRSFLGAHPPNDDITVLVIRVDDPAGATVT